MQDDGRPLLLRNPCQRPLEFFMGEGGVRGGPVIYMYDFRGVDGGRWGGDPSEVVDKGIISYPEKPGFEIPGESLCSKVVKL